MTARDKGAVVSDSEKTPAKEKANVEFHLSMVEPRLGHPNLGLGIGLRTVHIPCILQKQPAIDWFEIISENFIDFQGRPGHTLDKIAEQYPLVMHRVSLSIGSTDPLNFTYLKKTQTVGSRNQCALDFGSPLLDGARPAQHTRIAAATAERNHAPPCL